MIAAPAAITTRSRTDPVIGTLRLQVDECGVLVGTADVRKYSPDPAGTIRQTGTVYHHVPSDHATE